MKKKIKRYILLVNDISNLLLKKDRVQDVETIHLLRKTTLAVSIILVLSIMMLS